MIAKLICWLFGHDYEMVFTKPGKLDWSFICSCCGKEVHSLNDAVAEQRIAMTRRRKRTEAEKNNQYAVAYGAHCKLPAPQTVVDELADQYRRMEGGDNTLWVDIVGPPPPSALGK